MKYIVTVQDQSGEFTEVGTKSKKQDAIDLADATRKETRRTAQVHTDKGTLVHEVKGVRPMKSTPRFSKTVQMPEGVAVPEGARPAYLRLRHDAVIVAFDGEDVDPEDRYGIVQVSTGKLLKDRFPRTRDAGKFVLTLESPKAREARLAAEKAAKAEARAAAKAAKEAEAQAETPAEELVDA